MNGATLILFAAGGALIGWLLTRERAACDAAAKANRIAQLQARLDALPTPASLRPSYPTSMEARVLEDFERHFLTVTETDQPLWLYLDGLPQHPAATRHESLRGLS